MSRTNESVAQPASGTDHLKDAAVDLGKHIRDVGGEVRDIAQEKFSHLRDQAGEYYQKGRKKADEWHHDLESYVQEKPLKSLLIAAGVGMLLGVLWRRR